MSVVPLNYNIFKQIGVQFEPQGPGTQLSNMDPLRVKIVSASKIFHAATNLVDVKKWDGAELLHAVVKEIA